MGMLTAGAYARPGVRHRLALDLGTSTVRLWTSSTGEVLAEPAVLCRPGNGRHVAGRAALTARAGAARTWPVRDGVVRDFFACVHLLRLLAADLGLPPDDAFPVLVGVPATATLRQRNVLVAAVRRALGGRVVAVEEPLAAALACRPDPGGDDLIVVDIGSGRTEVARIRDRSVAAAERVEHDDPVDRILPIADSVRRLSGPGSARRPGGAVRRLILTGGGAAVPGVAARLAALTGLSVTVPADPPMATLTGLRRLLTG
ncbi:rod shape-determining protein [Nucisporomicrobium flavum]|uniref:rod shape-determining protein n=1 Tax=Nucisporomicrobium flavum TaxID=2785915 RepID=UPI0018F6E8E6|nr:rod shape-determining protein [Nucisporomicrobium flavum]